MKNLDKVLSNVGTSLALSVASLAAPYAQAACTVPDQSCNVTQVGTAAQPAKGAPSFPGNGNGNKGGDGGSALGVDLSLQGSTIFRNSGSLSPLQLESLGADGAQGSNATKWNFDKQGGNGGAGGNAGKITAQIGPQVGGVSIGLASAVTIKADGGDGGAAGIGNQSGPPGTAGIGGTGGEIDANRGRWMELKAGSRSPRAK